MIMVVVVVVIVVVIVPASTPPSWCDNHIRFVRVPFDLPAEPPLVSERPESSGALVRRAAEDDPVFRDEHIIGMPGPTCGIAPGGRHKVGGVLRVVDIGEVDAPEAAFFPGAMDDLAADVPLDVVSTHPVSEPVLRTIRMHVQRRPEP